MEREIGDILQAKNRSKEAGFHYIIFYDGYSDDEFEAGVLTTTNNFPDNILMDKSHFVEKNSEGNNFKITFNNSKLIPVKLFKPEEWGPYRKVGQLTDNGINFVREIIGDLKPVYWKEYVLK